MSEEAEENELTGEQQRLMAGIARRRFGVATLSSRNRDELDFYSVAVWSIRDALREAYEAGRDSARP
jgi:hypothetical protein